MVPQAIHAGGAFLRLAESPSCNCEHIMFKNNKSMVHNEKRAMEGMIFVFVFKIKNKYYSRDPFPTPPGPDSGWAGPG